MAKPVVLLYEQIHEDALAILEEKAEIRWAESLHEDALLKQMGAYKTWGRRSSLPFARR